MFTEREDKMIDCKHAMRNVDGFRVCTTDRGSPSPAFCSGCRYRNPRRSGNGLGDWVEWIIDKATAGRAKKVAAKKKGGCGCAARKAALNRIGAKKNGG